MLDVLNAVARLDPQAQQQLALDLASIVAPYGTVAADVVDPASFAELSDRLAVAAGDQPSAASSVCAVCESIIDRFPKEPEGAGFFAFGAVISAYYASCALLGVADAGVNSAKRFLDLLDEADDQGEAGLLEAAVQYLRTPSATTRHALFERVDAHAATMR